MISTFITKLNHNSNHDRILSEAMTLWRKHPDSNQISLRHRAGAENILLDGVGTIDKNASEHHYDQWSIDVTHYTRQEIERLGENLGVKFGRARFMCLKPKTGLTVHRDQEKRYHLVLSTNQHCWVGCKLDSVGDATTIRGVDWHLPADDEWYCVDTTKMHWVYNGGTTDRIHLVLCVL